MQPQWNKTLVELQQANQPHLNYSREREEAPVLSCSRSQGTLWRPSTQARGTLRTTQQLQAADWHDHKPR